MKAVVVVAIVLGSVPCVAQEVAPDINAAALDVEAVSKLRERLWGKQEARVRVGREWVELTRPTLVGDTALAFRDSFFDRFQARDSLSNPIPLQQLSVVQVKGKTVLPSVLGGSVSLGISALASLLLTRAVNSNSGIDGDEIVRVTLLAFGAGAAVGAIDGMIRTRWVTVWRRTGGTGRTDGPDGP